MRSVMDAGRHSTLPGENPGLPHGSLGGGGRTATDRGLPRRLYLSSIERLCNAAAFMQ